MVRVCILWIRLEGVQILYGGLAVVLLLEIPLAALEVFPLPNVRVP
jgi:hypothetical protein